MRACTVRQKCGDLRISVEKGTPYNESYKSFELEFGINEHFDLQAILNSSLKVEQLWIDKSYTWNDSNRYSFSLVEDTCIIMDCSIRYF
jgi:hypothetical protein